MTEKKTYATESVMTQSFSFWFFGQKRNHFGASLVVSIIALALATRGMPLLDPSEAAVCSGADSVQFGK